MKLLTTPLRSFLDLLYPPCCEVCGRLLVANEHTICTQCKYELPLTLFWESTDNPAARLFWGKVAVEQASSFFYFTKGSPYRKLMHKLKYKGKTDIGVTLGRWYGEKLAQSALYQTVDIVVPLPLHAKRLKRRGYNQSELIAEGIADAMQKSLDTASLQRTVYTETQTNKSRMERWKNVESVFKVANPQLLNGKHVLLVDDILTTGATLEVCALSLLEAASCKVSVATLGIAVY